MSTSSLPAWVLQGIVAVLATRKPDSESLRIFNQCKSTQLSPVTTRHQGATVYLGPIKMPSDCISSHILASKLWQFSPQQEANGVCP